MHISIYILMYMYLYVCIHTHTHTYTHTADAWKESGSNIASAKGLDPNSTRREHILIQVNGKARDRRVVLPLGLASQAFYHYICILRLYMCPHTPMCPQTIYVSTDYYMRHFTTI